jgi:hypothetical protein
MVAVAAHVWLVRAPRRGTPVQAPGLVSSAKPAVRTEPPVRLASAVISAPVVNDVGVTDAVNPGAVRFAGAPAAPKSLPIAATSPVPAMAVRADARPREVRQPVQSEPRSMDVDPVRLPLQTLDRTEGGTDPSWVGSLSAPPADALRSTSHILMAVAPRDPASERQAQEQVVRDVLDRYASAFERLDVRAAKAMRPTLDDRALQRAFEQLDAQQVRLGSCSFSINEHDANARCQGSATYHPKVGRRAVHVTGREWTFNLSKADGGWQIVDARIQE